MSRIKYNFRFSTDTGEKTAIFATLEIKTLEGIDRRHVIELYPEMLRKPEDLYRKLVFEVNFSAEDVVPKHEIKDTASRILQDIRKFTKTSTRKHKVLSE